MLLYLPERLYEYIKFDDEYHQMATKYTENIFNNNNFLDIIKQYNSNNPDLIKLQEYVRTKIPNNYLIQYDIIMNDDISKYENQYNNMDAETKMFYLYSYNDGDMSWNKKADENNYSCIDIYEKNFVNNKNCSLYIHAIYYFRKIYELLFKYSKRKLEINEFNNFKKEELDLFNKIISLSDNESFKHIMYSKREKMYILYLEFVGQFMKNKKEIFNKIWNEINNDKFKYNNFSYSKLAYYLICFQQYMDESNINDSKECLSKIIDMISYAYDNKKDACKSLIHYNEDFIDDFLALSKFIYTIVYNYMPNLKQKWDILHNSNLKPSEYRYYTSTLTNDDKEIVKTFNVDDRFYSYKWILSNKELLKYIDYLYLDK